MGRRVKFYANMIPGSYLYRVLRAAPAKYHHTIQLSIVLCVAAQPAEDQLEKFDPRRVPSYWPIELHWVGIVFTYRHT